MPIFVQARKVTNLVQRVNFVRNSAAWGCNNRSLVEFENELISSTISFFKFPKDSGTRKVWCSRIKRIDGQDNFRVTSHTVLCEKHFAKSDIIKAPGGTRRRLRDGAKPTLFENVEDFSKRKAPVNRPSPRKKFRETSTLIPDETDIGDDSTEFVAEPDFIMREEPDIEMLKHKLMEKISTVKIKFVENVLSSDASCKHYTGIPNIEVFKELLIFLNPGQNGENVILYNNQDVKGFSDRGRPRTLSPLESFLLTLVRMRRNFDVCHLSYLFEVSEGTVTNTFQTWVNYMYVKLGTICIWPSRSQVQENMPASMKERFANVRCIIDCVEFKIAVPSSLYLHKMMYSEYKSHTTVKVLVGIAPGGGFTFISSAYPGSISDKDIVVKSGLLFPELWQAGDAIMADRGFLIEDYVKPLGVELIMPSFLKGREQFSESEVVKSQQIASERIHVERMIQRLKCFRIFDRVIPVNMLNSLNQIISVCGILTNFQDPILK
ncbi:uncharacterized protein LOC130625115 [Hydractinia symbiolongicarpus]|uniref:uncharacterized protein LOC130625115 n=1 Tax=Hydractinia symbiolongicarpus TaxID=13093 RepID=UPI00254EAE5C|nr:uncharacterized protein LOC130625115 [Hydractinia symbiolongicarpus]